MQSQLGMFLPFVHKSDGGQIKQEAHPMLGPAFPGAPPALKYYCTSCKQFVEPEDVVDQADYKPESVVAPPGTSVPVTTTQPTTGGVKLNPPTEKGT